MIIDSNKIRLMAEERGLSISKLAFCAGISKQYLSESLQLESMSRKCTERVACALCCPVSDIVLPGADRRWGIQIDRVKLIAEMAKQRMSGKELAWKSGISNSVISKARNKSAASLRPSTVYKIGAALGVAPEAIMKEGNEDAQE